jgi:hypothetical protein
VSKRAYAIISAICIAGAIIAMVLDKPDAQFVALLGAGTTLAGRGKDREELIVE